MTIDKQFILAGEATFTIEVPPEHQTEQPHYTWKVQKVEANDRWPEAWFVKLLTGPDNDQTYSYVGKLNAYFGRVELTSKSTLTKASYCFRLFNKILNLIWMDDPQVFESKGFQVHHEGKCCRCGRKLTVPESVKTGVGPECAKAMGLTYAEPKSKVRKSKKVAVQPEMFPGNAYVSPITGNVYTGD